MNDENELRRALTQVAPTPPPNPSRATAAVSRARRLRTRHALAGGVVAVLVAVSAPFAVKALVANDPSTPDPAASLRCPSALPEGDARTAPELRVTRGAVAVRVCGDPAEVGLPTGILRTGADEIARQILELPVVTENWDMICSSYFTGMPMPRSVVFGYPDGSVRTAFLTTCNGSGFQIGGDNHGSYVDVRNVFAKFDALLREQDGSAAYRPSPVELKCADRPRTLITRVPKLVDGVLCETLRNPIRRNLREVPLSHADLAVLASDVRQRVAKYGSTGRRCGGTTPEFVLVARDTEGVTYRLDTCAAYPTGQGSVRRAPSAESQNILDRLALGWPE